MTIGLLGILLLAYIVLSCGLLFGFFLKVINAMHDTHEELDADALNRILSTPSGKLIIVEKAFAKIRTYPIISAFLIPFMVVAQFFLSHGEEDE